MSLQWSLIAAFLYAEIVLVTLLLLPFISAQRWQKLFKSRFLKGLAQQIHIYFYVLLGLLVLCLLDAVREMWKYDREDSPKNPSHQHLEQELRNHMVLFRAQRNFYITGFSLFLVFVIRRLMTLLVTISTLAATSEANMRQAQSASRVAEELMNKQPEEGDYEKNKELAEAIEKKNCELKEAREELTRAVKDAEAMKSQAESVSREYDRLMDEHARLQKRLALVDGEESNKKGD